MRAAIVVGLAALALAGCQTTKPADPKAVPVAPVDAKIHAVSTELAGYCGTAKALLPVIGALAGSKPAIVKVVASGNIAVARFCESPPDDVNEAIMTMARIAADLVTVWRSGA